MMSSIYLEAGSSSNNDPPYIVVGTSIKEDHYAKVQAIIDTLPISKRLHKIKKLPSKHYLEVSEVVRLINQRTYPKAITSWMEIVNIGDVYRKGPTVASLAAIKRVYRCIDRNFEVHLRTSYNLGNIRAPLIYDRGLGNLDCTMLIALSLAKNIKRERKK